MDNNNFQRAGSISNSHAGRDFEASVRSFLKLDGLELESDFRADVGHQAKKSHKFDLGSEVPPILVECKSYTWTSGGNSPSAKIRGLNEAMLLFHLAPGRYRKMLFMQKDMKGTLSLGQHYLRSHAHLVPSDVELWELDVPLKAANRLC